MASDTASHAAPDIAAASLPLETKLHAQRERYNQLADSLGNTAAEVQALRDEVHQRSREADQRLEQWSSVQRDCSELVLKVVRDTAGLGRHGAHRLRAMIDVLRRDEQRLHADLARLAQVHDQEDTSFRTRRHSLDAEKASSETSFQAHMHSTALATHKSCDHRARCAALRLELQSLNERYCDEILTHARSVFLVSA